MFKHSVVPFILSAVAGLALFLGHPAESSAQLRCGWCVQYRVVGNPQWYHGFYYEDARDDCAGLPPIVVIPGTISQVVCSRCGGSSECHGWEDRDNPITWGKCHIRCGMLGGLAEAVKDIQKGLATQDLRLVATTILRKSADLSVHYSPDAGRIDFVLLCDPTRAARTIAIPPEVRGALDAHVAAGLAAAARPIEGRVGD